MKIDILAHGNPIPFQAGKSHPYGGAVAYAAHIANALAEDGCDIRFVLNDARPREDTDIILLASLGLDKERHDQGASYARTRIQHLQELSPKIPTFICIHGTVDFRFFRQTIQLINTIPYKGIILMGNSKAVVEACDNFLEPVPKIVIPLPYQFKKEYLTDRTKFSKTIASPARISSFKGTGKVLDLAKELPKFKWLIRGKREGLFWGHNLRLHPHVEGKNLSWIGDPEFYMDAYKDAAFAIDLTLLWYQCLLEGQRAQYSTLESVNSGLIPITWKHWDSGYWKGIFLPSPVKKRSIRYNDEAYITQLKGIKYDWNLAKKNYNAMRRVHDYEFILPQYMSLFKTAIRNAKKKGSSKK